MLTACGGSSAAPPSGTNGAPAPTATPAEDGGVVADASGSNADASATKGEGTYFPPPGDTWETVDAASAGFDAAKLDELATWVEQASSTSFVILYDGRIVLEKYWRGSTATTTKDIASAQKSVTSLLVGQGVAQGAIDIEATVTSVLGDGWSNGSVADEAGITVRHLLTMTSGLDSNLQHDAPPGTKWEYNTDAYHRLELVLQTKTGKSLQDFTRAELFDPIGAGPSEWTKRAGMKDAKGVPVSALEMTARDMARVGLLVMTGGVWKGKAIVPASWMTAATSPSQTLNPSYGLLFWLNGHDGYILPGNTSGQVSGQGMLFPHAPADVAAALGAGDQKIYASASTKLVVTRQGAAAEGPAMAANGWDDELWTHIMGARTAAH